MNAHLRQIQLSAEQGALSTDPLVAGGGIPLLQADGHLRRLEALEADIIRMAVKYYGGQMSEVARRLGIGRSTLYRKLGELGIQRRD